MVDRRLHAQCDRIQTLEPGRAHVDLLPDFDAVTLDRSWGLGAQTMLANGPGRSQT